MIGLEQRAALELQQKMAISPRLLQALGLLQLPVLELGQALQLELQENPLLEQAEEETAESDRTREEPGLTETGDFDVEAFLAGESASRCGARDLSEPEDVSMDGFAAPRPGLADDLRLQLHALSLNNEEMSAGEFLIDSLDDDGYLRLDWGHLPDDAGSVELLRRVLVRLKGFEPAGVFAADLQECLEIQIHRLNLAESTAGRIICRHFEELAAGRFTDLAAALGVEREKVMEAVAWIREHLNPRPGAAYGPVNAPSVYPDLSIFKRDGEWVVLAEDSPLPRIRLSRYYVDMWRANPRDPEVGDYLRERFERARWVLRAIEQRRSTLQRIGNALLELQRGFFESGPGHLRRMTLADVAEIVEVHVSTVSRAVAGKYVQTPHGIIALRDFFQSGVDTRTGGDCSAASVKRSIAQLVAAEDPKRPLSDDQLAEALRRKGLVIARRTVSKYRGDLGIPSSRLRVK